MRRLIAMGVFVFLTELDEELVCSEPADPKIRSVVFHKVITETNRIYCRNRRSKRGRSETIKHDGRSSAGRVR